MIDFLTKNIEKMGEKCIKNLNLKNKNSMKLSCICSLFVEVKTEKHLIKIVKLCNKYKIRYFILGAGTNVLMDNGGYSGIVLSTKKINFIKRKGEYVYAGCGTNLFVLNEFVINNNLSGLEFSYGIPGSVGGATIMNAGAFGSEIKDCVYAVKCFDGKKVRTFNNADCFFNYRTSIFQQKNFLVLSAVFKLNKQNKEKILEKSMQNYTFKKKIQPYTEKSAGSIFKREKNIIVSKLIDEMGLKGTQCGGAEISTKHAGFIINKNNATSDDVFNLINIIKKKVANESKIDLQLEVKLLGDKFENIS